MSRTCCQCPNQIPGGYKSHRCPDCTRSYTRQWRANNPEKRKSQRQREKPAPRKKDDASRVSYRENEARYRQRLRETDPLRYKAMKADKRARRVALANGCIVSQVDVLAVVEASGGLCALCRAFVPQEFRHIDHIVPLDRGGPHSPENLQLTCYRCNTSKGARLPEEVEPEVWVRTPCPDQPFLLNPNWK